MKGRVAHRINCQNKSHARIKSKGPSISRFVMLHALVGRRWLGGVGRAGLVGWNWSGVELIGRSWLGGAKISHVPVGVFRGSLCCMRWLRGVSWAGLVGRGWAGTELIERCWFGEVGREGLDRVDRS